MVSKPFKTTPTDMADVINTESSLLQISLSFADYLCITYILSFRYITYRIIVLYWCDVLSPCLYQSPSQTKTNYVRLQYLPPSSPTNAMPGHLRHGAISGHRQPRLLTGTIVQAHCPNYHNNHCNRHSDGLHQWGRWEKRQWVFSNSDSYKVVYKTAVATTTMGG